MNQSNPPLLEEGHDEPTTPLLITAKSSAPVKKKKKKIVITDPVILFQNFMNKVKTFIHDEAEHKRIEEAYQFACERHTTQRRASGEPYICHPISVADVLADLRVDGDSLIAGLLHDVVEDTETTIEDIEKRFGAGVARLVDGVTKLAKIKFVSSQERLAENFRKMILAMARDLRVIIIKLADRLHNMRTLGSLSAEKRKRIAQETLEIYAPLAGRLGIYSVKSELEDLCLKNTKYEVYQEIARNIAAKKGERSNYISEVKEILESELKKYGFKNARVSGRPKHFYSIYKKMVDRQLAFKDIHDLFAFRVIVDSIKECYEVVGVVHAMWKPMPGRFKDYIAMPKPNLYQSLHTTVIRPNGTPAEIQIRTHEMHDICEHGVAAHWAYKERKGEEHEDGNREDLKRFAWLRQIMETQHDVKDPNEFLQAIKVDLFEEEIYVFTPKGHVFELPVNATPLDFAFLVHTDVGLSAVGAKINGRIGPLRNKLHSGDIVEIITSPQQKPSKDWLNYVITSKARNRIRAFFRSEERDKSRRIGREVLEDSLSKRDLSLQRVHQMGDDEKLYRSAKESSMDELLIAIGYGKVQVKDLLTKVYGEKELASVPAGTPVIQRGEFRHIPSTGVLVSGLDNILVSFGKCCNPLPGEDIFGFITRGRGVSVHRSNCAKALDLDPARRVRVSWSATSPSGAMHNVYLRVVANDRQALLADVTVAVSKVGGNIKKAEVKVNAHMKAVMFFELLLKDINHLQEVIKKIEMIPDVILAERVTAKF